VLRKRANDGRWRNVVVDVGKTFRQQVSEARAGGSELRRATGVAVLSEIRDTDD
jgi:hypothetical protein